MGKIVLITGATSGIGNSIGKYLSEKGYVVYGTGRNPQFKEKDGIRFVAMDVSKKETITSAVEEILQKEGKIDFLINNAGMGITGPLEETPDEQIARVFEVNYFGVIKVIKAVLPSMRKNGGGFIINITSIAGYMGLPYRGVYSATKGALELTTEAFRMELKDFNIKMTNIAPGDFATNIAAGRYHAPLLEDSPYKAQYGKTLELMDQHVDSGKDPILMAKKVYSVMQQKNPTIHYKVGAFIQKFSIALKHILPDKLYEKMLLKHYKL
ncbi:MAG TPA: SDR family oxidoreductase [Flavobacteriaceae bacterium]|nr:SDR family oxidoreductase [Flavobacteriaceae bacterium]